MGCTVEDPQEKNLSTAARRARRTQGFGREEAFAHLLASGPRARYDVVPPLYRSMMFLLSWELTAVIWGEGRKGTRRKRADQSTTRPCSVRRTKDFRVQLVVTVKCIKLRSHSCQISAKSTRSFIFVLFYVLKLYSTVFETIEWESSGPFLLELSMHSVEF